jgi:hypothetical protein
LDEDDRSALIDDKKNLVNCEEKFLAPRRWSRVMPQRGAC